MMCANDLVVIIGTDNCQVRNRTSQGPGCISCALFGFVFDAFNYDIYLENVVTRIGRSLQQTEIYAAQFLRADNDHLSSIVLHDRHFKRMEDSQLILFRHDGAPFQLIAAQ